MIEVNQNVDLTFIKFIITVCKYKSEISKIEKLIEFTAKCRIPKFPISGDDLKKYGYKSDKDLGKKLESLKDQWIKNNFFIDKKKLEKALEKKF